jgi:tight adherence protein B
MRLFESQFPDALDMMRNAVRAGFALIRALQLVGTESPDPVGMEFRKTSEEINLGIPLKDALMDMTTRVESLDLRLFVTALLIQRESGGNLNEVLFKLSSTIRERFKLAGQIKIYTAQGRMSQLVLGMLPIAFALIVSIINPDYMRVLIQERQGHVLIAAAIIMQVLGYITIRKIISIKMQ